MLLRHTVQAKWEQHLHLELHHKKRDVYKSTATQKPQNITT